MTIRLLCLDRTPTGGVTPRRPVRMSLSLEQFAELYGAKPAEPSATWDRSSNCHPPGRWAVHRLNTGEEVGVEVEE